MASFSKGDVNKVLRDHRQLRGRVELEETHLLDARTTVRHAAEGVVEQEAMHSLAEVSVDELGRMRRGLRIKSLKDAGFQTVADVYAAPQQRLSAVHGISAEGARFLKVEANKLAELARKGARLRLSSDNRTREATALLEAVNRYHKLSPLVDTCKGIESNGRGAINDAMAKVKPRLSPVKWLFFTPRASKQEAEDAYEFLLFQLDGAYGLGLAQTFSDIESLCPLRGSSVWDDFARNSTKYFNTLEDIVPELLSTWEATDGLPEELAKAVEEECFFPDGLLVDLRRYQEWGVKYILHQRRVLLGDEMGLGKTVQAIATMVSLRNIGETHFMVVCPASVLANWCREVEDKSKLAAIKIHGQSKSRAVSDWLETGGVAVTTYETTGRITLPDSFRFGMLVVDEAHYIKNPEAQRTVNVKRIGRMTERILFMTGTPLENKVSEMVELISYLQPKVARNVRGMEALPSAPIFRKQVAPVYYRRRREDVLQELPDLIETNDWCTMGAVERHAYEQSLHVGLMAARRVSWNAGIECSSKARRLREIVEEAAGEGRKILVFSFFLDTIESVMQLFGSMCRGPLNGSVPPQRRQEIIDEFENAPAGAVLAAQIQAGGTGLNIQSASVVVICEPQYKPSTEEQAISRAYRMGQTRAVLVHRLLCEDSIDERMTERLAQKQREFDAFADKSVAAEKHLELSEKEMGNIIQEELDRIAREQEGAADEE